MKGFDACVLAMAPAFRDAGLKRPVYIGLTYDEETTRTIAVSFATEAGHFQAAGLSIIVCGPGSIDHAHKSDEFVDEAQLEACLDFLARLAEDFGPIATTRGPLAAPPRQGQI